MGARFSKGDCGSRAAGEETDGGVGRLEKSRWWGRLG